MSANQHISSQNACVWSRKNGKVSGSQDPNCTSYMTGQKYFQNNRFWGVSNKSQAMIERTQCLAACYIWGSITDQSEFPCNPLSTVESTYSRYMSIRAELDHGEMEELAVLHIRVFWSYESHFPELHFLDSQISMYVAYLGKKWNQDAPWDKGKWLEAMWCAGCSGMFCWKIRPFIWMLLYY